MVTSFFFVLDILPVAFIFLPTHYFLINTWSLQLIWPIITSLCVFCTTTCKHFASSLKINTLDSIFWLVHILNIPTLIVPISPCSSCRPSIDYTQLFADCVNSSANYDSTSTDYTNKSDDCMNTPNDWANTFANSNTPIKSSLDLCIANSSLL